MNRAEALELIAYAAERWGGAAAMPDDETRLALRVQVWVDALGDLPAPSVRAALASATDEFPPNVGVLRSRILAWQTGDSGLPSWDQFWAWVRDVASRCSLGLYPDALALECPWPSLDGLLTLRQVTDWAQSGLTAADLELVIQAHVRRTYDARMSALRAGHASSAPAAIAAVRIPGLPAAVKRAE